MIVRNFQRQHTETTADADEDFYYGDVTEDKW